MKAAQFFEGRRPLYILLAIILIIAAVAVFYLTYKTLYPSTPVLKAVYVIKAPKLDGKEDPVWDKADPVTVDVEDGPDVTMKAVYTKTKVYILASYPGDKRGDTQFQWRFDGKEWTRGPGQDIFGIFFNTDNSIKGFNDKGFGAMVFPEAAEENKTSWAAATTTAKKKGDLRTKRAIHQSWPYIPLKKPTNEDLKQRGDFWEMSMAVSNQFGKCLDWTFAPWPPFETVPGGFSGPAVVQFNHNKAEAIEPFINNGFGRNRSDKTQAVNLPDIPEFMYKPGKNVDNTPYPRMDDVVSIQRDNLSIPESSIFKKGDKLPYVVFDDKDWNGQGFDVDGKANFAGGAWTVEISRDLKTKNADSIVFNPKSDESAQYYCAILLRAYQMKLKGIKCNPGPLMILEFQPI